MITIGSFRGVLVSWAFHSASLLLFVFLVSGFSFSFASAASVTLFFVFVIGFLRFSLYGGHGAIQFIGGALLASLWFPLALALLDWAIGGGASPANYRFYVDTFKYTYSRETALFTWAPAAALIIVASLGGGLGLLTNRFLMWWKARPLVGGDPQ